MILALPLGFLATRYDGWLIAMLERTAYLAQGLPGIVVALSMVSLTITIATCALSDRRPSDGDLRHPLPAACPGQCACRAGTGAARAGGSQPRRRARLVRDLPARVAAFGRAGSGRRRGNGLHFGGNRADRDPADGADRHSHACGSDLGQHLDAGFRRGGTLCRAHDGALSRVRLAPRAAVRRRRACAEGNGRRWRSCGLWG